jgi:hypothetical protein
MLTNLYKTRQLIVGCHNIEQNNTAMIPRLPENEILRIYEKSWSFIQILNFFSFLLYCVLRASLIYGDTRSRCYNHFTAVNYDRSKINLQSILGCGTVVEQLTRQFNAVGSRPAVHSSLSSRTRIFNYYCKLHP